LGFLRIVEVFPPTVRRDGRKNSDLEGAIASFVAGVRQIKDYADLVLVASLKDPNAATVSTTAAASIVSKLAGVEAAPVIVVRDYGRKELTSTILGAYSLGLGTLMLAWGDRKPGDSSPSGLGLPTLASAIDLARGISKAACKRSALLAPINLDRLSGPDGVKLAKSRLDSGASLLLAQPPTTDSLETFDRHLALLDSSGLRDSVVLNIFPFRGARDVLRIENSFGWSLPRSLRRRAANRDYDPVADARSVVKRLREEGLPGVYLSTRGSPELARQVLR
jgi:5,10-methylenetetrahydrofolate reductase